MRWQLCLKIAKPEASNWRIQHVVIPSAPSVCVGLVRVTGRMAENWLGYPGGDVMGWRLLDYCTGGGADLCVRGSGQRGDLGLCDRTFSPHRTYPGSTALVSRCSRSCAASG